MRSLAIYSDIISPNVHDCTGESDVVEAAAVAKTALVIVRCLWLHAIGYRRLAVTRFAATKQLIANRMQLANWVTFFVAHLENM